MAATAAASGRARRNRAAGQTGGGVLLAAIAAHAPLVAVHLGHVSDRPHYRFALFLFPIVGWLMWRRWPRQEPYLPAWWTERLLLGGSVVLLGAAIMINSPYLAALSAILAIGFAIVHQAGLRAIPALFGTWMLLWLTVPPPLGFDLLFISWMQSLTSQLASNLLDLFGINHLMAGNILHLPETSLFVDEACSGVHSLFALTGCTAVFAVVTFRTVRRSILLLASSLCCAVLLNLLRVMTIALAHAWWRFDLSGGWVHAALGLATFLTALGLLLSTDQWLDFVGYGMSQLATTTWRKRTEAGRQRYRPSSSRAKQHQESTRRFEQSTWGMMAPSRAVSGIAMAAYGLLLATSVSGGLYSPSESWTNLTLTHFSAESLPEFLDGWMLRDVEFVERDASSALGRTSIVWTYWASPETAHAHPVSCRISLDAPFSGWHELTRCYEGQGWCLDERRVADDPANPRRRWVESTFSKTTGEHALLVFAMMSAEGRLLTPTEGVGTARLIDRLRDQPVLQCQGFVAQSGPIDEQTLNDLRTVFGAVVGRITTLQQEIDGGSSGG